MKRITIPVLRFGDTKNRILAECWPDFSKIAAILSIGAKPDVSDPSVNHGRTTNSGPSIKKIPITLELNFASSIGIYKRSYSIKGPIRFTVRPIIHLNSFVALKAHRLLHKCHYI